MAATSGLINIVEFISCEYANVDVSSSTLPTILKSITSDQLKQGSFSLDIPEESVTSDYTEDGETYNVRVTSSAKKAVLGLATATASTISDFTPSILTSGIAGSTPDKLKFGASSSQSTPNKYVKLTGRNSDGKIITVELFNAKVTYSWSGANGKSTEPQPFTVTFNVLRNRGFGASFQISPEFGTPKNPPYMIGQAAEGGFIGYILQEGDYNYDVNIQKGLVVAPSNQSAGIVWALSTDPAISTTMQALGSGFTNTANIVNTIGTSHDYAAKICKELSFNGYNDWYLPSASELFAIKSSGILDDGTYWSSSEESPTEAISIVTTSNGYFNGYKTELHIIRAVRSFSLTL